MTIEEVLKVLGGLAGLATAVAGAWKTFVAIRTSQRASKAREADRLAKLDNIVETVGEMAPKVEDIQKELKANGGGSIRDAITDLRNEHALERAARRNVTLTPVFEIEVNAKTKELTVLHVSPAFVRLTGLTRDDCEEFGWIRAVSAGDRDRVQALAEKTARDATVLATTYTIAHVHTGERVRVEHIATPVFNTGGALVGWVGVYRELPPDRAAA